MQRFPGILLNILRNNSKLECDALPIEEISNPVPSIPNNNNTNLPLQRDERSLQLVEQNNALQLSDPSLNPLATNNILAVNNTQGQTFYNFSHVNGLHLGASVTINNGVNDETRSKSVNLKTPTIKLMMESQNLLSRRMLITISKHLGKGWRNVMRDIDFSDGEIHQAIMDYKDDGGIKEVNKIIGRRIDSFLQVIYQLLLEWSRKSDDATVSKITNILWNAGHRQTVCRMKDTWKLEMKEKEQNDE